MSDISVARVVKTTTADKDSYAVLLKGEMRLNASSDDVFDEVAKVEVNVKGIEQIQLLEDNGLFRIGAVKAIDLRNCQTALSDFAARDPHWHYYGILDQELWIDSDGMVRTRNEVRDTYLDLEEEGAITDQTFLQFLEDQTPIEDLYEETPETMRAIRMHKHGYSLESAALWGIAGVRIQDQEV